MVIVRSESDYTRRRCVAASSVSAKVRLSVDHLIRSWKRSLPDAFHRVMTAFGVETPPFVRRTLRCAPIPVPFPSYNARGQSTMPALSTNSLFLRNQDDETTSVLRTRWAKILVSRDVRSPYYARTRVFALCGINFSVCLLESPRDAKTCLSDYVRHLVTTPIFALKPESLQLSKLLSTPSAWANFWGDSSSTGDR